MKEGESIGEVTILGHNVYTVPADIANMLDYRSRLEVGIDGFPKEEADFEIKHVNCFLRLRADEIGMSQEYRDGLGIFPEPDVADSA